MRDPGQDCRWNSRGRNHDYAILLEKELTRMVGALRKLGAKKLILFGSYANGHADPFTDLDLMVVLDSELSFVERTGWLYKQRAPRVAADILVYSQGMARYDRTAVYPEGPFGREGSL